MQRDQHQHIPRLAQDATAVQAFQELNRRLLNAPIFAYPQFHGKLFILDTDFIADLGAIGGAHSQEQDGEERVIAYGACRLQLRKQAYTLKKGNY